MTLAAGTWVRWTTRRYNSWLCLEDHDAHDIPVGALGRVIEERHAILGLALQFLDQGRLLTFPGMDERDVVVGVPTDEEAIQWTIAALSG